MLKSGELKCVVRLELYQISVVTYLSLFCDTIICAGYVYIYIYLYILYVNRFVRLLVFCLDVLQS